MSETTIICKYCSYAYPKAALSNIKGAIANHTQICDHCSLHQAELKIEKLRSALAGLIGAETKEELDGMELALRTIPTPASDKAAMIDAIDALRECLQ